MSIRLHFGKFKNVELPEIPHRVLSSSVGFRPTTSMARSTLFNVLMHSGFSQNISNASVLDLCCGTGLVGLEFISMGARNISFVDKEPAVIDLVKKNISFLGIDANNDEQGIKFSVQKAPIYLPPNSFDIIFFDPPYDLRDICFRQMEIIAGKGALKEGGVLVVESDRSFSVKKPDKLKLLMERPVNSKTKLTFWGNE